MDLVISSSFGFSRSLLVAVSIKGVMSVVVLPSAISLLFFVFPYFPWHVAAKMSDFTSRESGGWSGARRRGTPQLAMMLVGQQVLPYILPSAMKRSRTTCIFPFASLVYCWKFELLSNVCGSIVLNRIVYVFRSYVLLLSQHVLPSCRVHMNSGE